MPTPQEPLTPADITTWIETASVEDLLVVWDALYEHDDLMRAIAARVRAKRGFSH
jgi:hypothetical protein